MPSPARGAVLLLLLAACVPPKFDPDNRHCDPAGKCLAGYACVKDLCVKQGSAGTPCSGNGDCTAPGLVCRQGTCDVPCTAPACECDPGQSRACPTTSANVCAAGTQSCTDDHHWGACVGQVLGTTEVCNGLDDDCNGVPDNGFLCVQDADAGSCTTTCGTAGSKACNHSCDGFVCTPPAEVCNGLDDDCDGSPDNGFLCVQNADAGSCTTSCGSTGSKACNATCDGFVCTPPTEVCNGLDDDCNGAPDDTFTCVQNADAGSCTTSCGSTGNKACNSTCDGFVCTPPVEVCNGLDDDCNGAPDDTFACVQGANDGGACHLTCDPDGGASGTLTCASNCSGYVCQGPAEVCNRLDDNCDGNVDEGLSGSTHVVAPPGSSVVYGNAALALGGDGGVAIYTEVATPQAIQIQLLDAQLLPSGAPVGHTPSGDQTSPAAASVDGGFEVAWLESGGVLAVSITADGTSHNPVLVNANFQAPQNLSLAGCASGAAFAWENAPGGQKSDVVVRVPGQPERNITSSATGSSTTPAIAAKPDGSAFGVAYAQGGKIRLAILDATGAPVSDAAVSQGTFDVAPTVAWNGSSFVVAWTDAVTGDIGYLDPDLSSQPVKVTTAGTSSENPRLVAGNGLVYLTWDDNLSGTFEAKMIRLDPGGAVAAGPTPLDAATDPSLAPVPAFSGTDFGAIWIAGGSASVDARLVCF